MGIIDKVMPIEGRQEWRKNWPVLLTAMIGFALSQIHLYSIGIMIGPLERAFGWSRTEISSGLLIVSFVVFPLAPFMGRAIDRFGPRSVALAGTSLYCISLAALSLAQQPIWTWWLLWVLVAFGSLFMTPTIWITAICSLFDTSRGLALAMTMSATGLMSLGGPLLTNLLIANFGWRMTYVLLGLLAGMILIPLIYLFFFNPKQTRVPLAAGPLPGPRAIVGLSVSEALRSPSFVKLAATGLLLSIATMSLLVNLVPILTSFGIESASVPAIAGVVGITQIIGRLGGGFLLDHVNPRQVGAVVVLLPAVSSAILLVAGGSPVLAAVAVLTFGVTVGAEIDVIAYLAGRFVGMRNFGMLFGGILALLTLGTGLGPLLASYVYDLTRSYDIMLWIVAGLSLVSSVMLLTLGNYPEFDPSTSVLPQDSAEVR